MRFAPWALTLTVLVAPAACSSNDDSVTNTTGTAAIATVAPTASTLPPTTAAPPTSAAQPTTTTTTTAPSTTTATTVPTTTTTSRVVPRPVWLTDKELEVYTTNYNQLLDTIEASQQAWRVFTHDPFNEELAEAYLNYHIEPMLTAALDSVEQYRTNNYFTELSGRETFDIDPLSVEFDDDYTEAVALACETDAVRFLQRQPDGTATLLNDDVVYKHWSYKLVKQEGEWMITIRTRAREDNEGTCS